MKTIVTFLLVALVASEGYSRTVWSPDGTQIAFDRWDDVTQRIVIFIMATDGGSVGKLMDGSSPAWLPDRRLVVKESDALAVVNVGSLEKGRILEGVSFGEFVCSPDGTRIQFMRLVEQNGVLKPAISHVNIDGSDLGNSYIGPDTERFGGGMTYAPDGNNMFYFSTGSYGSQNDPLDLLLFRGGRLLNNPDMMGLCWNPDSQRIAFDRKNDAGQRSIYEIDTQTRKEALLVENAMMPSWSPDGRWLAFVSSSESKDGQGWDVYLHDTTGQGRIRLTEDEIREYDLLWSPDATRLLFVTDRFNIINIESRTRLTVTKELSWGDVKARFHGE